MVYNDISQDPHRAIRIIRLEEILPSISKLNNFEANVKLSNMVDVVVPVFNAYEDLLKCLDSLFNHFDGYKIILINDCSSDQRINELFQSLKSYNSSWIEIIEKNKNEGFVRTANIGLEQSVNDIILLNSDTIVTHNWAKKLVECAYSEDSIATVTPFTNNGSICTVPIFNENKDIPDSFDIDSLSDFIEKVAFKNYPEIPTAVGFCMFVKREIIDKIGLFDEKSFGEGYGEENDFCMRAKMLGYKHVLCDNTFIFHKGGASFLTDKDRLNADHLKILYRRYPEYQNIVYNFYKFNPLRNNHENIKLRLNTWDSTGTKKRILYILHPFSGGTEKHVLELSSCLDQKYILYTLYYSRGSLFLRERNLSKEVTYRFQLNNPFDIQTASSESYKDIFEKIINTFKIDIIHIHQMIGHTFDITVIAEKYNIPIIYTIHDFYCVCPKINLLNECGEYCRNFNDIEKCNHCLSSMGYESGFIIKWRNNFKNLLDKSRYIISPSASALDIVRSYYPLEDKKTRIIEHGHLDELLVINKNLRTDVAYNFDSLNIMTLGSIWPYKGERIIYELSKLTYNKPVKWFIIGSSSEIHKIGYNKERNIYVTGAYKNYNDLLKRIKDNHIQLAIFPSIWPETFCYALSECWMAGIPPIVSNLGALEERVAKTGCGWAVEPNTLSFKEAIDTILSNNDQYEDILQNIKTLKLKSLREMAHDYINIYEGTLNRRLVNQVYYDKFDNQLLFDTIIKTSCDISVPDYDDSLLRRLIKCYNENGFKHTFKKALGFLRLLLNPEDKSI